MAIEEVPEEEIEAAQGETVFPWETPNGSWRPTKNPSERWRFLEASYYGNGGYADGSYLIPHRREDMPTFVMRKNKSRFINDFRAIINGHVTPVFRGDATREYNENLSERDKASVQMFLEDCDGAGTPYPLFLKKTARAAKTYGSSFVLCDRKPLKNVITLKDLEERDNLPYLFLITPDRILDIAMNEKGEVVYIKWVTYQEDIENRGGTATVLTPTTSTTGTGQNKKITVVWTPQYFSRTIEGNETTEKLPNELGYVPVFPLYPEGNDDPVLEPYPYGMEWALASIQNRIFNIASIADELADSQAYSILVIPGELPENKTLGTGNALTGMAEQGNLPTFISPDAEQLQTLSEIQRTMVEEMYRTGVMPHLRTFAESAESKMLNSERTYEVLVDFRAQIQQLDKRIMDCFAGYMGLDLEYQVSYPQKFGLSNLETDFEAYTLFDQSAKPVPGEIMAELMKRIKSSLFQGLNPEMQEALDTIIDDHYAELDEMPTEDTEVEVEEETEE